MQGTSTILDELVTATLDVSDKTDRWCDAFGLAYRLGLDVQPREREGAVLCGQAIEYDRTAAPPMQQRLIAQEVARWALLQWGLLAPVAAVQYVADRLVELDAATDDGDARPSTVGGLLSSAS
jgi:hypothetical protein